MADDGLIDAFSRRRKDPVMDSQHRRCAVLKWRYRACKNSDEGKKSTVISREPLNVA